MLGPAMNEASPLMKYAYGIAPAMIWAPNGVPPEGETVVRGRTMAEISPTKLHFQIDHGDAQKRVHALACAVACLRVLHCRASLLLFEVDPVDGCDLTVSE